MKEKQKLLQVGAKSSAKKIGAVGHDKKAFQKQWRTRTKTARSS